MTQPEIQVFTTPAETLQAAAQRFATLSEEAAAARGRFLAALSGGSTPQGLYERLARPPYRQRLPWARLHIFWGDERCVPPDHPGSNYRQAKLALFDHVPIPTENLHRIRGELPPDEAARKYAQTLHRFADPPFVFPRFDLALLGMGADGHTASLFPGPLPKVADISPTLAVTAHYQGRPADRVTLTPQVFNAARNVIFLVIGAAKAEALAAVLHGPHNPEHLPAQRIRPTEGKLTWLVDKAAASRLV